MFSKQCKYPKLRHYNIQIDPCLILIVELKIKKASKHRVLGALPFERNQLCRDDKRAMSSHIIAHE